MINCRSLTLLPIYQSLHVLSGCGSSTDPSTSINESVNTPQDEGPTPITPDDPTSTNPPQEPSVPEEPGAGEIPMEPSSPTPLSLDTDYPVLLSRLAGYQLEAQVAGIQSMSEAASNSAITSTALIEGSYVVIDRDVEITKPLARTQYGCALGGQ